MAKKKKIADPSSSEEEQQQYIVEVITKARVDEDGEWEYYVKWAGYDSDNNTWEPQENVAQCDRLLRGFWKDIGVDEEDYPKGHTVYATPTWITKEKAFFAKHFGPTTQGSDDEHTSDEESDDEPPPKIQPLPPLKKTGNKGSKKNVYVEKIRRPRSHTPPSTPARKAKLSKKSNTAKTAKRTQQELDADIQYGSDSSVSRDIPLTAKKTKAKKRIRAEQESSEDSSGKPPRKMQRKVGRTEKGKEKAGPMTSHEDSDRMGSLFSGSEGRSSPDVSMAVKGKEGGVKDAPAKASTSTTAPVRTAVPSAPVRRDSSAGSKGKSVATGIPTKMRLAEAAQSIIPLRPTMQRSKLSNLPKISFKKNTLSTGSKSNTPMQEKQPSPSSFFEPSTATPTAVEDLSPFFRQAGSLSPATETRNLVPLPRRTMPPPNPVDAATDVDRFLSTVMPVELAAPMDEMAVEPPVRRLVAPTASTATKPVGLGRIPKKWKWTGEAFIDVEEGRAQRLCNVLLSDMTDPLLTGLRFTVCLNAVDSIRLGKLHEIADLYMILSGCGQVQQFIKFGPSESEDTDAINTLAAHMKAKRSLTYARLNVDGVEAALMFVFPPSVNELTGLFKVPDTLMDAPMVAALVQWDLTREEFDDARWFKLRIDEVAKVVLDPAVKASAHVLFTKNSAVHRALRILNVPHPLFSFLSSSSRSYCVWYSPADGLAGEQAGMETTALRTILAAFKAKDVGYKADVRIVFVHVGALRTLYKLPALAERRCKRHEIRFYMYGTHESVPPERWGIREVYKIGGIVTFTPSAILSNIFGVYELIKKIAEHPLWECYVLPSVVAMLAKLTCQDQNPLTLFDKGDFMFSDLLDMMAEGDIALLRTPPVTRCPKGRHDPAAKWISWQTELLRMDARGLLEASIALAAEQYSDVQPNALPEAIQTEILRDLIGMQMQPAIMDGHRRFVAIKSSSDKTLSDDRDGVECTTVTAFDFKDDWFKT